RGKGYFEQFKDDRDAEDYDNLIIDGSDVIQRRWLNNHFYVINGSATYKNNNLEIISGASYNTFTNDHYGEIIWGSDLAENTSIRDRYYFSDATKNDFSVFSKATFNVTDRLKAFLDVQGRFVTYETEGLTSDRAPLDVDESFSFFNPKLGITYTLNASNSLYASYARANREPNRNDYESNGDEVTHESLNDFELGWRYSGNKIKLNANVYYMSYDNQLVLTGALDNVGEYLRENVKDSYRLGLEVDATVNISNKLTFNSNVAISQNKIKELMAERDGDLKNFGDTNIAFSPNVVSGNALTFAPKENLQFSLLGKYVSSQYLSNTDTKASKLSDYFVSDLNVVYEIPMNKVFKSVIFTGLVNNIFDREYVDRGYTYLDTWTGPTDREIQGYFPQATINFLVGMTLKF
ncbi:TonB-dependent receptor, partial [Winogradskyella sp.]|uniref:TonB-dependent receptor n=1 Tax=Winogradskyella sp. TaxID=1883156 RepID=UPI0025E7EF03